MLLAVRFLTEQVAERGEPIWLGNVDLEDVFGSLGHTVTWPMWARRMGACADAAQNRCVTGHALKPLRMGMEGAIVRRGRGCRQGAPESPHLCNTVVNEDMGPTVEEVGLEGQGMAPMPSRMVYADNILLVATSATEAPAMIWMPGEALQEQGLTVQEEQL